MKFTAKEIEHLTYRALHDYQYSDYAAYAPHLLEEFAKVNLEHVSSPAGANSPSAPEIVLNPTLAWPQRIYAFVGHYLHLRLENRNITPLEVLQAGILLLHMDFYSIDDVDLKNKLLNILAKQPHSLFDLYHLHIEHTENLYATTDAVVIDILMHVVKLHAKNIEDLDTSARQNAIGDVMVMTGDERDVQLAAKIWRRRQTIVTTQYTINALVLRLNAEFTSFLNKLNTQGTNIFEHQQLTQLIAFIMEYPFLHALSSNVQLYILHIVATLISNNSNNLVHAHYIEEVLRCLTTKGSRHAKAQLIKTLHEHLSPHLKEKFCAFLKQDLQANPQAYSTAIRELLYHYHFLLATPRIFMHRVKHFTYISKRTLLPPLTTCNWKQQHQAR
ncbi:MAG TPA: hypothetical protein VLG38_05080 [Gammaproteobacteria bacterium]|nr:hypothetical protein [Gammaproteobacteria bacterium]